METCLCLAGPKWWDPREECGQIQQFPALLSENAGVSVMADQVRNELLAPDSGPGSSQQEKNRLVL